MIASGSRPTGISLSLTVEKDVANGFLSLGKYDATRALVRSGAIDVDVVDGSFQFELRDGLFSNRGKPLRRVKPARVSLDRESLFDIVQRCRAEWQETVIDRNDLIASPGKGQKKRFVFEEKWEEPVDTQTFREIGGRLARAGQALFDLVFDRDEAEDLARDLRMTTRQGECVFTVNAPHFHLPWGMLYTHPDPNTPLDADGFNFDPRGFWGYQHIVEQFTNDHPVIDQLRPVVGKLGFGVALHPGIASSCLTGHQKFVAANESRLNYAEWTTRRQVEAALSASPFENRIVYFLCHAEGAGSVEHPSLRPPALELADAVIEATDIRNWIQKRLQTDQPLVFLNACRAGQLGTLVYRNYTFATQFLERGAACVIGPQTEVPAVFAGEYGRRFFEELLSNNNPPKQVGPAMRDLARFFWEKRNPLGLAYSLYAGADCHIQWREER
jgi:hypothetical protein